MTEKIRFTRLRKQELEGYLNRISSLEIALDISKRDCLAQTRSNHLLSSMYSSLRESFIEIERELIAMRKALVLVVENTSDKDKEEPITIANAVNKEREVDKNE